MASFSPNEGDQTLSGSNYSVQCQPASSVLRYANLKGTPGAGCTDSSQWLQLPPNGGSLNLTAIACQTNIWYIQVVGTLTDGSGTPNYGSRISGYLDTSVAGSQTEQHSAGCDRKGDEVWVTSSINGFSYSGPMQRFATSSWPYDPCKAGVYTITYTPVPNDIGKSLQASVTSQILVTPTEYNQGIRESAITNWTLNVNVVRGTQCPAITVTVSPKTTTLHLGQSKQFAATVTSTSDTSVTWATTGGGITPTTGLYTAPNSAGTYTVSATSHADTTKKGIASVTVQPNYPPVFSASNLYTFSSEYGHIGTRNVTPSSVRYQFNITDANNDPITFSLAFAQNTAHIPNVTMTPSGLLTWDGQQAMGDPGTPVNGGIAGGVKYVYTYNATVTASDGFGWTTTHPILLNVTYIPGSIQDE